MKSSRLNARMHHVMLKCTELCFLIATCSVSCADKEPRAFHMKRDSSRGLAQDDPQNLGSGAVTEQDEDFLSKRGRRSTGAAMASREPPGLAAGVPPRRGKGSGDGTTAPLLLPESNKKPSDINNDKDTTNLTSSSFGNLASNSLGHHVREAVQSLDRPQRTNVHDTSSEEDELHAFSDASQAHFNGQQVTASDARRSETSKTKPRS